MNIPKITNVLAVDDHTLIVYFDNNERKKYDVRPLLGKAMFAPLGNAAFFKSAKVEQGGYAVVWNDQIDISEYELWIRGEAA